MNDWKRLTPEEMTEYAKEAAVRLRDLPQDAVREVAKWWNQWYMYAGHKRLGRLLRTYASEKSRPTPQRSQSQSSKLISNGSAIRTSVVSDGIECQFSTETLDSSAFMTVRPNGGTLQIVLNEAHPGYPFIAEVLFYRNGSSSERTQVNSDGAQVALRLILEAWAKYEDAQPPGRLRELAVTARNDWGRAVAQLLNQR